MKVLTVVGARPQFVKAGALSRELRKSHEEILVHTGQHYDDTMSRVFFEEMEIPRPDYTLAIGSSSHGRQTGAMLMALEDVMISERPDAVLVYGDTNSTLAGSLAAAKLNIRIAHVEAGLRSFNRRMPEELNRILTDHLSHWLFVPSGGAAAQLAREGITTGVVDVGDIMLDAVQLYRSRAAASSNVLQTLALEPLGYHVATIHRAENTDDPVRLGALFAGLGQVAAPVIMPLHPRTAERIRRFGIDVPAMVRLVPPCGYLDMLQLEANAGCVITDSGGVQKEAYYLDVPCLTLRGETEWTETITTGWNLLCDADPIAITAGVERQLESRRLPHPPLYGSGDAAARIANALSATVATSGTVPQLGVAVDGVAKSATMEVCDAES